VLAEKKGRAVITALTLATSPGWVSLPLKRSELRPDCRLSSSKMGSDLFAVYALAL
jgi:hypothetical protein